MTHKQETLAPAGTVDEGKANTTQRKLTPRLYRLARALLAAPEGLTTWEAERAAKCRNSPEYVRRLRRLGLTVPCLHVPHVTTDGVKSWYGVYRLTPTDREKLEVLLQ